jgi:UDP-N-acetyl-D-glucosamine dehydrogenase
MQEAFNSTLYSGVMQVVIIGQGYVGLNLSIMASRNHKVVGLDINKELVRDLNNCISHIEGISDGDLREAINHGYEASALPVCLFEADIVVIAVPTPLDSKRKPDMTFLESACKLIGEHSKKPALIINESTSYPGTVREFIKPLIESKQISHVEHLYAVAPERVDPGNMDWNLENTPRLVSGLGEEATSRVKEFYSQFCSQVIEVTSPEVAEAAKLFENTFRQVNIALVNEFAKVTNKLGISVYETLNAADTKPYGFLKFSPSLGVGGHCIPIDPSYLADTASKLGIETKFINLANETNLEMPNYIVSRIESDLRKTLKNKKVLVLGVAYKPNVADTRETPSKLLINELRKRGADVYWHDPLVEHWNGEVSSNLQEVDAIVIAQMHDQFLKVKLESYSEYIFDCTGTYATPNSL